MSADVIDLAAWRAQRAPATPSETQPAEAPHSAKPCPRCRQGVHDGEMWWRAREHVAALERIYSPGHSSYQALAHRVAYARACLAATLEGFCHRCDAHEAYERRKAERGGERTAARRRQQLRT